LLVRDGIPSGWLYEDREWAVGVLPGTGVPGWVTIMSRRHANGIVELRDKELTSLGPTLARVAKAVYSVTQAEKVYFASFGERYPHFHVLVMPRGAEIPVDKRGPSLQLYLANYADVETVNTVAGKVRKALTSEELRSRN
jgi:diadenosine tetraphosphate (Ap4A) HIT family hydrolase